MQPIRANRSRRWPWGALAIGSLVVAGVTVSLTKKGDLWVYLKAAERMTRGEEIYRPEEGSAFTYPPLMALPAMPLVRLPDVLQKTVWFGMNAAALGTIVWLLRRRIEPCLDAADATGRSRKWFWIWVGATAAVHILAPFEGLTHDLFVFLAVLAAIDASCQGNEARAGFFAGTGAALKATPLLFLPVFLWRRQFRAAACVAVSAVALSLVPDLLFPRHDGRCWVLRWYEAFVSKTGPGAPANAVGAWHQWDMLNQSLAGTVHRLCAVVPDRPETRSIAVSDFDARATGRAILIGQIIVLALVVGAASRRTRRTEWDSQDPFGQLVAGGAILCGMVLLSPMSSKPHFCVLLLPIAVAWAVAMFPRRARFLQIAMVLVLLLGWLTNKDVVGKQLGDGMQARGSITLCAVTCLVAMVYTRFRWTGWRDQTPSHKQGFR